MNNKNQQLKLSNGETKEQTIEQIPDILELQEEVNRLKKQVRDLEKGISFLARSKQDRSLVVPDEYL